MKRFLLLLCTLLVSATALAQPVVYSDGTTNLGVNSVGRKSAAAVDAYGALYTRGSTPASNSSTLTGTMSALVGYTPVSNITVLTGSTATVLNATAHPARVGDVVACLAGTAGNINAWSWVSAVTGNTITLSTALPATPANGDTCKVMRPTPVSAIGNGNSFELYVNGFTGRDGLAKQEDNAAATLDTGIEVFQVREDTLSQRTSATGDIAAFKSDAVDRTMVNPWGVDPSQFFSVMLGSDITTTSATVLKSFTSSQRIYVTDWGCTNTSATATRIDLLDGSTAVDTCMLAATSGWCAHSYQVPVRGTASTSLQVQAATAGAAVRCSARGFVAVY